MTNNTWRRRLMDRYPEIFLRTPSGDESLYGYAFVGDGWRDLIEVAVERIAARAPLGSFRIDRIEEKYGTVVMALQRVQAGLDADILSAVDEAVALAEARSASTCQICGAEGALYDADGWFVTRCAEHAHGVPVPVRPGWDNVELLMVVSGGHLKVSRARRYDRLTDTFIDIDPSTLEVDE